MTWRRFILIQLPFLPLCRERGGQKRGFSLSHSAAAGEKNEGKVEIDGTNACGVERPLMVRV